MAPVLFDPLKIPTNLRLRTTKSIQYGASPIFNFDTGEFYTNSDGTFIIRDDKSGFTNQVRKAIITPRNVYPIYSQGYGSEIIESLVMDLTQEELKLQIAYAIRDCLIHDPRITDVFEIVVDIENDKIYINFKYSDIWGKSDRMEVVF